MEKTANKSSDQKLVRAHARYLRVAPRKVRVLLGMLKGMSAADALVQLEHNSKKSAPMLARLLKSAIANAKNNFSLDPEKLYIKALTCDMGPVMKRYTPRARGAAFEIRRKTSHINVILEERGGAKVSKASASRLSFLKKKAESVDKEERENVIRQPAKSEVRKSQIFKTEEQVKASKVQQKRRLFSRKSGE